MKRLVHSTVGDSAIYRAMSKIPRLTAPGALGVRGIDRRSVNMNSGSLCLRMSQNDRTAF